MKRRHVLALAATGLSAGCLRGQSTAADATTPTPETPRHRVGESFVVGDAIPVRYRVASTRVESQTGGQAGQYRIITLEYQNVASQTVTVSSAMMRLETENHLVDHDLDADAGLSNPLGSRQVQPDERGRGELVFPVAGADTLAVLHIEPVDVGDGATHRVTLV